MNRQNVKKWCAFSGGVTKNAHNESKLGRPSVIYDGAGSDTQWLPVILLLEETSCEPKLPRRWWNQNQIWNEVFSGCGKFLWVWHIIISYLDLTYAWTVTVTIVAVSKNKAYISKKFVMDRNYTFFQLVCFNVSSLFENPLYVTKCMWINKIHVII